MFAFSSLLLLLIIVVVVAVVVVVVVVVVGLLVCSFVRSFVFVVLLLVCFCPWCCNN